MSKLSMSIIALGVAFLIVLFLTRDNGRYQFVEREGILMVFDSTTGEVRVNTFERILGKDVTVSHWMVVDPLTGAIRGENILAPK